MPKQAQKTSQSDKFKEAAKKAGCSDDETAFDDALRKIGKSESSDKGHARPKESR